MLEEKKGLLEIARELIIDRCLIHGLPHIVDRKKSLWIRIFWSFLLFLSLLLYFYFLFLIYDKLWINPDIPLNFGHRPINELPFPAVTICSPIYPHEEIKAIRTVLDNPDKFPHELANYTANAHWCEKDYVLEALEKLKDVKNLNVLKMMSDFQPKLEDFLVNCTYGNKPIECSKLFVRVLTVYGYCFTYNMQDHETIFTEEISKDFDGYKKKEKSKIQWTLDQGYITNSTDAEPKKATKLNEIAFTMRHPIVSNNFFYCPDLDFSFQIFFHLPNELITSKKSSFHTSSHYHDNIFISAKSFRMREEVRRYAAEVRNCYFEDERKLRFFKKYTGNLCRFECFSNFTFEKCGCVQFSMPRNDSTRICTNYDEVDCMFHAERVWKSKNENCDCLESCNGINYFSKFSQDVYLRNAIDDDGKVFEIEKNLIIARIKLNIAEIDVHEDTRVYSYDSTNLLVDIAGLTGLFTGCSIISILEILFFTILRRLRQKEENEQSDSTFDDFLQKSSIEGAKCFHSSESKFVKIFWTFVFFLCFCGLGFYVSEIHKNCKLKPRIFEEIHQIPMQEIPFPAITICSPVFARNLRLYDFLKNPAMDLNTSQRAEMAASLQGCSPELASKFSETSSLTNQGFDYRYLYFKFWSIDEIFSSCIFRLTYLYCSRIMNYVLTDYGYCHSFNLEGFSTIFNVETITNYFAGYNRRKLSKNYYYYHPDYNKTINDDNQPIEWTLENGYLTDSKDVLPVRAKLRNRIQLYINRYNETQLCPEIGKLASIFFHMPNEILTPFHKPFHADGGYLFDFSVKYLNVHKSLRPYPPSERDCYFDGEKSLKFFKSYTKAHCDFECLTNFTLNVCGCVKFSMPRENSTKVCGINETPCYVEAMRNWSSRDDTKCDCLHSCTYIIYEYDTDYDKYEDTFEIITKAIFGLKIMKVSGYGIENGLADFGGMLGVFFGASLISLIEIFYFLTIGLIKRLTQIQSDSSGSSEIAEESTFHGVQFIFQNSTHIINRGIWIITFVLILAFGLFNARGNHLKFTVNPETGIKHFHSYEPSEEIPLPAVTLCSPIFSKKNLTANYNKFLQAINTNTSSINELTNEEFYHYIANLHWISPNLVAYFLKIWVSYSRSYEYDTDLAAYLNRSHFELEEFIFNCTIDEKLVDCSKVFKRILTFHGICYAFNIQSFHTIFNREISSNFDSYGRYEEAQDSQWSLDHGFNDKNRKNPSFSRKVSFCFQIPSDYEEPSFLAHGFQYFYIQPTDEVLSSLSKLYIQKYGTKTTFKLFTVTTKADENIRRFKPQNRGCYFQNERKLQFFKTYTKSNCEFECLTNFTLKNCGCVSFLQLYNQSTKICKSIEETHCFDESFIDFPPIHDASTPCGCLPTCNKLEYVLDDSYNHQYQKRDPKSLVSQFAFELEHKQLRKDIFVTYGFLSYISDLGGLLGLFLGCSILSFFELIYFPVKFIVDKFKKKNETEVVLLTNQSGGPREAGSEVILEEANFSNLQPVSSLRSGLFLNPESLEGYLHQETGSLEGYLHPETGSLELSSHPVTVSSYLNSNPVDGSILKPTELERRNKLFDSQKRSDSEIPGTVS